MNNTDDPRIEPLLAQASKEIIFEEAIGIGQLKKLWLAISCKILRQVCPISGRPSKRGASRSKVEGRP